MTTETNHGAHEAHAKGLAALMNIRNTPLSLLGSVPSGNTSIHNKAAKVSTDMCYRKCQLTPSPGSRNIFHPSFKWSG